MSCSSDEFKDMDNIDEDAIFYRTYPLLYHKFGNMGIFRPGNLYSLSSPGNEHYQKIILGDTLGDTHQKNLGDTHQKSSKL